ncbi:MAG TPA: RNA 2',3'-cyclic phosphodiesterase [Firmicutes bacterium]|jgi:2'-5' RNA ligase|nr:RNA 2',3'-cyclic phosphodiesterase [Bacillota bacterium]
MRLFLAVWLSEELQKIVGDWLGKITAGSSGIKWVFPGQLHFTLKFLGEQDPDFLTALTPYLRRVAATTSSFPLNLAGGGTFPPRRPPRVLWLGVDEGRSELTALAGRLEAVVQEVSAGKLAPEKRGFKPHLTIGRVKSEAPLYDRKLLETGVKGLMTVNGFSLVESKLTPQGPRYRDLEKYFLQDTFF